MIVIGKMEMAYDVTKQVLEMFQMIIKYPPIFSGDQALQNRFSA